MILAGDIGGTKTILALFEQQNLSYICHKKTTYINANFTNFSILLADFLQNKSNLNLDSVCIGAAGPVENNNCSLINLPWVIKHREIASQVKTNNVILLNDLEATAWGVLYMSADNFVELNPEAKKNIGNIAVIAAGTGLGEAQIIWNDKKYHVVASEGGHTDYAPRNEFEIGLLRYLMCKFPEHVSYERVVCGQGLVNIYAYLKSIQYAREDNKIKLQMQTQNPAAVISTKGATKEDKLCAKTLQTFCEIYGAVAGNLALKCLPKGGIILAGGATTKNLPSLQSGSFMQGYLSKGRYRSMLKNISIKVCVNSEVALIGAINYAKTNLKPTKSYKF